MTTVTTIHLIDQPGGGITVCTTAGTPHPGQRLTPGQALATDLLRECTHRASDVRYWQGHDKAMELVQDLLNPDQYGYAVSPEVHRAARRVMGLPPGPHCTGASMTRARPTRGTDSITRALPNETSVHIVRPKPAPLRQAGLQPIGTTTTSAHGKPLVSPVPSQAELQARRKSERLEMATDCTPVRNSTQRGKPYTCPELRTNPYRPGSADAYSLPSRTSFAKKG